MVTRIDRHKVRELLDDGAQVIEALPRRFYDEEHIPGAISMPLTDLNLDSVKALNPDKPTITYCANEQCDLGPRAASRLETLGFTDVYEYSAGKDDWLSSGNDFEGTLADVPRAIDAAKDVAVTRLDEDMTVVKELAKHSPVVAVVNEDGILMGRIDSHVSNAGAGDSVESLMEDGPKTVRPSEKVEDLLEVMDGEKRDDVLVTDPKGALLGIVFKDDAAELARDERDEKNRLVAATNKRTNGAR
jgi:rhodanese-related sulfurtransferase/CBS domain-containing protein